MNNALTELNARTEKKLNQLQNVCQEVAELMARPRVRKAVCDAMQTFLMEQRPDTSIGSVSVYFKISYARCRGCTLDLSDVIPEIQTVLDERDNSMKRIQDDKKAIQTKLYDAKTALKDQIMLGDDAEKLLGQLTEFRNTVTELVNNF